MINSTDLINFIDESIKKSAEERDAVANSVGVSVGWHLISRKQEREIAFKELKLFIEKLQEQSND